MRTAGKKRNYNDYPMKKKLLISHGIIVIISVMIAIVLLGGIISVKSKVDGIYEKPLKNVKAIGDIRFGVTDVLRAIDRMMAENKRDLTEAYALLETDVERDSELIHSSAAILQENLLTEDGRALLQEMMEHIADVDEMLPESMELLKAGNMEEAYTVNFDVLLPKIEEINAIADELEIQIRETADDYYISARNSSIALFVTGIVLLLVGVLMAIAIVGKITEAITKPLQDMTEAALGLRQGNMSAGKCITYEGKDEIGVVSNALREAMQILKDYIEEISEDLKKIAQKDLTKDVGEITDFLGDFANIKESFVYILKCFNTTLTDIQESSDQVAVSSREIAGAASQLSEGATDQASAIEELTATIATVATLADNSAKTTHEAYTDIQKSADQAQQEQKQMEELMEEMHRITEISKEIENIITAIEDIASQTNLLSLNASIEAARAGEAGRGFAVVADQIGKLAADSAESAVNTRELIGKTLQEIEKGNAITESTSAVFEKIIKDMKNFADIAKTASEAAQNQSAALEQIEAGIDQIADVVQHTAASSEETSAISDDLSREAHDLDVLVKQFILY